MDNELSENLKAIGKPAGLAAQGVERIFTNQIYSGHAISPLMWEWGTSYEIESLRKFSEIAERAILDEAVNFKKHIENSSQGLEGFQLEAYLSNHSDEYERISVQFAQVHRSSIFLRSYGLLERILNYVCEDFAEWNRVKILVKDLKGQGIERAKIYLSKQHDFDFVSKNPEWALLQSYGRIRNLFAHTYGDLPDDDTKRKQITNDVNKLKFIKIDKGDIVLEENFTTNFLDILRSFFDVFFQEIEKYTLSNPAKLRLIRYPRP